MRCNTIGFFVVIIYIDMLTCLEVVDGKTQRRWSSKYIRSQLRPAQRPPSNISTPEKPPTQMRRVPQGRDELRVINASAPIASAIVFGGLAKPRDWSFMAFYRLPDQSQCGGVILSEEWVLTAAHCFDRYSPTEILIGAYRNDGKDEIAVTRGMKAKYCHEEYDDVTLSNDICLIKLSKPVQFTKFIRKGLLPPPNTKLQDGQNCTIMGWGLNERNQLLPELQEAKIEVINKPQCILWYTSVNVIVPAHHFCAGKPNGGADTCNGDSGGPLVVKENGVYTIRGITSFGPTKCGSKHKPGLYTDVSRYVYWIQGILNNSTNEYTWTNWTRSCSVTCGQGVLTKSRHCEDKVGNTVESQFCNPGKAIQLESCSLEKCQAYTWSKWRNSPCSVTCGRGQNVLNRNCVNTKGKRVPYNLCGSGKRSLQSNCVQPPCQEGSFVRWGPWRSSCGVTCGDGTKFIFRQCLNGQNQQVSAMECPGRQYKYGKCKRPPCQGVETLQWGDWKNWSSCEARSDSINSKCNGHRSATRECLEGDKDVNPERCVRALGGNFYQESACKLTGC